MLEHPTICGEILVGKPNKRARQAPIRPSHTPMTPETGTNSPFLTANSNSFKDAWAFSRRDRWTATFELSDRL